MSRALELFFYTVVATILTVVVIDLYFKGQVNKKLNEECQTYGYSMHVNGFCYKEVLGARHSQKLSYLRRRFSR